MPSHEEKIEIEEELKGAPFKRAASIDALKVVQRHRGWVDDQGLKDVAVMLEMTPYDLTKGRIVYRFREGEKSHES